METLSDHRSDPYLYDANDHTSLCSGATRGLQRRAGAGEVARSALAGPGSRTEGTQQRRCAIAHVQQLRRLARAADGPRTVRRDTRARTHSAAEEHRQHVGRRGGLGVARCAIPGAAGVRSGCPASSAPERRVVLSWPSSLPHSTRRTRCWESALARIFRALFGAGCRGPCRVGLRVGARAGFVLRPGGADVIPNWMRRAITVSSPRQPSLLVETSCFTAPWTCCLPPSLREMPVPQYSSHSGRTQPALRISPGLPQCRQVPLLNPTINSAAPSWYRVVPGRPGGPHIQVAPLLLHVPESPRYVVRVVRPFVLFGAQRQELQASH